MIGDNIKFDEIFEKKSISKYVFKIFKKINFFILIVSSK